MKRLTPRRIAERCFTYGAVLLLAAVILGPVFWLFIMSISTTADLTTVPLRWLPENPDWSSYRALLTLAPNSPGATFLAALTNSLLISIGATALSIVAAVPAAYSISRLPGNRTAVLDAAIATFMMPPVAIVVPIYLLLSSLGLLNTKLGLVLVYSTMLLPFTTWLIKSNFDTVPVQIEEAAIMDGAGTFRVIRSVMLPLTAPALGASVLFALLLAWDEFFYALLFTSDVRAKTLTVAIADFSAGRVADYALISAASVLAALPPVVIAFFLQKSLVSGLSAGGVKG